MPVTAAVWGLKFLTPWRSRAERGSGLPGGSPGARPTLTPLSGPPDSWDKYLYFHRVWGRSIFNPKTDAGGWQRYAKRLFGSRSSAAQGALASASRILPLITTTHGASGSNAAYWPEIYTNMPIADAALPHPYQDTPTPKLFGWVSPFDPQLFSTADAFAEDLVHDRRLVKYSPLKSLNGWTISLAGARMPEFDDRASSATRAEVLRWGGDISIQRGLGRFFAEKLRSAVLWSVFQRTGPASGAAGAALDRYRSARKAWAEMAEQARSVYVPDITYGDAPHLRGHWIDRLPAIDADLLSMQKLANATWTGPEQPISAEHIERILRAVSARPPRPAAACEHEPEARFDPGHALAISLSVYSRPLEGARLHYRRVNQAERWQVRDMTPRDGGFDAEIPAAATKTRFSLQYYFEVDAGPDGPAIYPGLNPDLSNQPYFTVRHPGRKS